MPSDLHCHTKLSDSSMGIDDLIVLAQKKGLTTIAITDRDCQAGTVRAKIIGERRGITVIPGVEISATDSKSGKNVEILGYLCDSPDRLEGLCHRNVVSRKKASQLMTLKIARKYPISPELVLKCATGSTAVFEQHIMHALLECGITDKIYGNIYHELFSPESEENVLVKVNYPEPSEVIEAIHEAGGIAVIAHPGASGCFEILEELLTCGVDGVEVWHPENTPEQEAELLKFARDNGILAIGGTDFKGMYSKKTICVGDCATPDADVKALMSYKTKMKKKKTATENK
ncbi:MAG: PHP domain-containing protein [Clostridia bacterium]|nr:PHP domain-containing protein [Clostridia bacterium]